MRDRNVRVGLVALILAMPWLVALADPASSGLSMSGLGSSMLTELVLVVGLLWAGRERRVLLSSRDRALRPCDTVGVPGVVEPAMAPAFVPPSRPSAVVPAS